VMALVFAASGVAVDTPPVDSTAGAGAYAAAEAAPVADRALLEDVMADGAVATGTQRPQLMRYVSDVTTAWLGGLFDWIFGADSFDETAIRLVRWMISALLAVLLGLLGYQWYRWWRSRHVEAPQRLDVEVLAPAVDGSLDWRAELERRLADGDADGALDALWWWLAARLGVDDAEASWTTPELARRAGRRDLMPLVRRWDRLVYGGGDVHVEPVRALWRGFDEALP
ncbi:MAG: hypothetical protein AAFY88_14725, partial [Acidobacteriota bacterium]